MHVVKRWDNIKIAMLWLGTKGIAIVCHREYGGLE